MLARLSQASLAAALQRLSPAISSKPAAPVLGGIRLRADADGFAMTAGSGGVAIETRLDSASGDAVIQRAGQIVIPSRRLLPLVRCLPEGAVSLEASNGPKLTIRADNACYRLSGMDADLYPDVETPRPAQSLRLPNRELKQLVKRIAFAAADSEARPVLTGICCSIRADGIAFTATDGVRLSSQRLGLASTSLPEAASDGRTAVIPAKRLLEFAGTLSDEGFTAMILGANSARLQTDGMWLQLPLLEGAYPALERIAAHESTTRISLRAPDFLRALERAAILAGENRAAKLAADASGLTLSARTEGIGDVEEAVPFQAMDGQPLTIAFNAGYMRDIMRAAEGAVVTLAMAGPRKPIVVTTADDAGALFALTPIRTANDSQPYRHSGPPVSAQGAPLTEKSP